MNIINKAIFSVVMFITLLSHSGIYSTYTSSYFMDTEEVATSTFTGGIWNTEADFLEVSDSKLTGNGEKLHGITLDVNGTRDITIDKIQVWWNISLGQNANITDITIHGKEFFSGSEPSGEVLDGEEDYVLKANTSAKIEFYFDSNVSDLAPFTVNIILGDGSIKSFVTDPKYRSDFPEVTEDESSDVGL